MDFEIVDLQKTEHKYLREYDYIYLLAEENRGLSQEINDTFEDTELLEYEFKVYHGNFGNTNAWNMIRNLRITSCSDIKTFLKINDSLFEFTGTIFDKYPFPMCAVIWDRISLVVKSSSPVNMRVTYDRIYTPQSMSIKILQNPEHIIKFTDAENLIITFGSCSIKSV